MADQYERLVSDNPEPVPMLDQAGNNSGLSAIIPRAEEPIMLNDGDDRGVFGELGYGIPSRLTPPEELALGRAGLGGKALVARAKDDSFFTREFRLTGLTPPPTDEQKARAAAGVRAVRRAIAPVMFDCMKEIASPEGGKPNISHMLALARAREERAVNNK